ncbi:MAG: sulfurtransferase [Dehalococcoidia bacterium]|nr:sulfurtransferase [Dehalococcoidia bacterium]
MAHAITPADLRHLFESGGSFALLDVREAGEYNSSHIPGSSLLSRRQIEFQTHHLVPYMDAAVVVCDDDGRRAHLASETLERMGYLNVSVLAGGINRWVTEGHPTEWGTNVPSKDFGERVEVEYHVPEIDAVDLEERVRRGDKIVILDTRTPEEYRRFCIPGGRSVPGGELALRISDILEGSGEGTTVVVNCAGRTRSIIGTRTLQRMGISDLYGLKNGTSGWVLAGYQLETGGDRLDLPGPSAEGLGAAEAYADRVAEEDQVGRLSVAEVRDLMNRRTREPVYLIDVRTEGEYAEGHIPGFHWFPGGQAVQRSDDVVAIRGATIVFACEKKVRSSITASWYRQMGFEKVYVVAGGIEAWQAAGLSLEKGMPDAGSFGGAEARSKVRIVSPHEVDQGPESARIFVGTSREFAYGHVPSSRWVPRGWLELQVEEAAPSKETPVLVTCVDGSQSLLAGGTLADLGYADVAVLEGGTTRWRDSGMPMERGLSGVMAPPADMVPMGPDRNYADMMNYLRWEEALGEKYAR